MNGLRQRVLRWVFGTHFAVLVLLLVIPSLRGCFRKEPQIIATFDLGLPPPPLPEIEPEPEPVPEIKPPPKPEKKPEPVPALTNPPPKKAETNPPPKKTEEKKPAVTNPPPKKAETKKAEPQTPPKPKTLEERLAEVRKGGKPAARPAATPAPQLDLSGLKSALAAGSSTAGSGPGGGVYSPFAGYYESVKQRMYSVWKQPAGAPGGLTATASIRVERDGTVSRKALTGRSGNAPFDLSVQSALNATVRLPVPPPDLPSRDIEIEFVLAD